MTRRKSSRLKLILYSLATLALLLAIAAGSLYCVRLGVDIGRKVYAKDWACVAQRNKRGNLTGMNCKIVEEEKSKKTIAK